MLAALRCRGIINYMKNILFFGDSLTSGHGLNNIHLAFPGLIQKKIEDIGLDYRVINAGLSGEVTAGGRLRIDYYKNHAVDIFVLELGANDGLRGVPVPQTYNNLQAIIDKARNYWPDCKMLLVGMLVPPLVGLRYFEDFMAIFPRLAEKNQMAFVPFLLENVANRPELNQADGVHPTAAGQEIMAETVWKVLKTLL